MNVYTDSKVIELEMDKYIMESCEDTVSKSFTVDKEIVEGVLAYLEQKYDVFVENCEENPQFVSLNIEWDRTE